MSQNRKENPHEILFSVLYVLFVFLVFLSMYAAEVFLYFFFLTGIQISLL